MLDITARDGAARTMRWQREQGPTVDTPGMLWVPSELAPAEAAWTPKLGREGGDGVLLRNTFSIQQDAAEEVETSPGSLLLRRRLEAPATMQTEGVELRNVDRVAVFPNALNLWRNPQRFAAAVVRAREKAGYGKLLYAPGLGEPNDLAVLAYCGVDLVDATPLSFAAAQGRFLSPDGSADASELSEPECACLACGEEAPAALDEERLRRHNQWAARQELGRVRNAIARGQLRELVESRARSHPEKAALVRRLDARYDFFEERAPVESETSVFATTKESLRRPAIERYRRRVVERYTPSSAARVLLLLPCSARKPYGASQSHRKFSDTLWRSGATSLTEEWIVTSPMGIVPRPLERAWPAARYDVPVTGEWDAEEGDMIRGVLGSLLTKRAWDAVVSHLPQATHELVADVLPDAVHHTVPSGRPTMRENLDRLEATLRRLVEDAKRPSMREDLAEKAAGLANFQFGTDVAPTFLAGARVGGKWPGPKLFDEEGEQLAALPLNKGLFSITLAGGRRLMDADAFTVEIDDFQVKGSVFAVGVRKADPRIRVGDEVVVAHGGEIRGVGVASMTGREMTELDRGEAVGVRHHA